MDKQEIFITASLAQLAISDEEAENLRKEISQMLEYFSKMEAMDISTLEPTTHALLKMNRTRPDLMHNQELADRILDNSPEGEDRFIIIPNVL